MFNALPGRLFGLACRTGCAPGGPSRPRLVAGSPRHARARHPLRPLHHLAAGEPLGLLLLLLLPPVVLHLLLLLTHDMLAMLDVVAHAIAHLVVHLDHLGPGLAGLLVALLLRLLLDLSDSLLDTWARVGAWLAT